MMEDNNYFFKTLKKKKTQVIICEKGLKDQMCKYENMCGWAERKGNV